MQKFVVMVCYP